MKLNYWLRVDKVIAMKRGAAVWPTLQNIINVTR